MYENKIRDWLKSFYGGQRDVDEIEITPEIKQRYLRYLSTPGMKPKDVNTELTGTEKLAQSTPVKFLGDLGSGAMSSAAGAIRGVDWVGGILTGRPSKQVGVADLLAKKMEEQAAKSSEMGFEEGTIPKYLAQGLGHAAVSVPLMGGTGPAGAFGSRAIAGAGIVPFSIATGGGAAKAQGKGDIEQLGEAAWSGAIGFVQDKILGGIGKKELSMIPRQFLGGTAMASIPIVADTARKIAEGKDPTQIDWGKVTSDFITGALFPIGKHGKKKVEELPEAIPRTPGLTEESFNTRLEKSLRENLKQPESKLEITTADELAKQLPPPREGEAVMTEGIDAASFESGLGGKGVGRNPFIELEKSGDGWKVATHITKEGGQGVGRNIQEGKRQPERITVERNAKTGEVVESISKALVTDMKILDAVKVAETGGIEKPVSEISTKETGGGEYRTDKFKGEPPPPAGPREPTVPEPPIPIMKERQTVTNSLTKEFGDMVNELVGKERFYLPEKEAAWVAEAGERIKVAGVENRLAEIMKMEQFDHVDVKEAKLLSDILAKQGKYDLVAELAQKRAPEGTSAGRTLRAWATSDILSDPALISAKIIREAKSKLGRRGKMIRDATPEQIKKWTEMAEAASKLPDGPERDTATALIFKDIRDNIPVSIWKKVSTVQAIHQLLNAKTIARNLLGNIGLNGMEVISHYIGMPIDALLSRISGQNRSVARPKIMKYMDNMVKGFRLSKKDIELGVNTAKESLERRVGIKLEGEFENMFEFAAGGTFKKGVYSELEKIVGYTMQAPDRAFFEARFFDSLDNMMTATGKTAIEKPMVEQALREAAKVTFRDMNNISQALVNIKKGLNKMLGNEQFGLGDIVLKYPKVPGAIVKRGIEYSPFGFIESAVNIGKMFKNRGDIGVQREAAMSTARAILGTILAGTGYALAKAGSVTGKQSENKKIRDFENAIGKRPYSIKALNRLFSYDWFQPSAMPFTMGVDLGTKRELDQKGGNVLSEIANYISGAIESAGTTVTEQPVFTGVSRLFGSGVSGSSGGVAAGLASMAESAPSSFVPTALAQIGSIIDPNKHQIPTDFAGRMLGLVANRIPGLSMLLEKRKDVLGEDLKRGTGNPIIDTIFGLASPTIMSELKVTPEINFIMQLFGETGETSVLPRTYGKTITYNNKTYALNQSQRARLQETAAKAAVQKIRALDSSGLLKQLTKERQIKVIEKIYNDAGRAARKIMLSEIKGKILKDLLSKK